MSIYFISPKNRQYFFSHRNELQGHFCPPCEGNTPSGIPIVRPPTATPPRCAGAREARGERGCQAKSQRGEIAEQFLRALGQRRFDGKRRSKRLKPWAFFRLIGELFADRPHRVPPHADARSKSGETGEKALTHTRAQHRVSVFLPSRIESNSVVHNALRVKRSNILTHRKHHATTSASTLCR